jgi:hypothetical protein
MDQGLEYCRLQLYLHIYQQLGGTTKHCVPVLRIIHESGLAGNGAISGVNHPTMLPEIEYPDNTGLQL